MSDEWTKEDQAKARAEVDKLFQPLLSKESIEEIKQNLKKDGIDPTEPYKFRVYKPIPENIYHDIIGGSMSDGESGTYKHINYQDDRKVLAMSETVVQLGQVVLWNRWAGDGREALCPALVTKCHEDGTVNLTIFPDGEGMQTRTQVKQGSEAGEWRLV